MPLIINNGEALHVQKFGQWHKEFSLMFSFKDFVKNTESVSWCEVSFACVIEAPKYKRDREKPLVDCFSEKSGEGNVLARSCLKTPESVSQKKGLAILVLILLWKRDVFSVKKKRILILLSIFSFGKLYISLAYLGQKHKAFNFFLRCSLKEKGKHK